MAENKGEFNEIGEVRARILNLLIAALGPGRFVTPESLLALLEAFGLFDEVRLRSGDPNFIVRLKSELANEHRLAEVLETLVEVSDRREYLDFNESSSPNDRPSICERIRR